MQSLLLSPIQRFLIPKGQSIDQRQFLAFSILNDLQLFGDVTPLEGRSVGLSTLRQKDSKSMLIPIEGKILSYQFIDDEILIGEIWSVGRRIIESTKYFSSDPRTDLRQYSPFF